jgi:hypothetical protein
MLLIRMRQIDEIKAAVPRTKFETPNLGPARLLLTSGRLTSKQFRIVVPLTSAEELKETKLHLWKGECHEETSLEPGITLIFEDVAFRTPHDVSFLVVQFPTSAH